MLRAASLWGYTPWHRDIYALRSLCFTSSHFGSHFGWISLGPAYSFVASRSRLWSTVRSKKFTLCLRWQRGAA